MYVVVDDSEKQTITRTSSGELKDHFSSEPIEHASSVDAECNSKKKVASKSVHFSTSPKRKPKSVSSPLKNGDVRSIKQQRTSPRKRSKHLYSPLKGGDIQSTKQHGHENHCDEIVSISMVD